MDKEGQPATEAEISFARLKERMVKIGDVAEPTGFVSLKEDARLEPLEETSQITGDLGGGIDNG